MLADVLADRPRLAAALAFLGVFAAGVATGLPLERWLHPPAGVPGFCGPLERQPDFIPRPYDRLGFDRRQMEQARPIIDRHREKMEALVRESLANIRSLRSELERDIRPLLDPAQARLLDDMLAHRPEVPRVEPGSPGGPPP